MCKTEANDTNIKSSQSTAYNYAACRKWASSSKQDVAGMAGIDNPQDIKHQINPGDFVGENLGWGNSPNTTDKILGPLGPGLITNGYKLFLDSSPHSNYFCEGSFCGYDKLNNNSNQPRTP